MPLCLMKVFLKASATIDTITIQELEIKDKIELPSNIRVVVLQRVKVLPGGKFTANRGCREVGMLHCSGTFNLSKIKKLESLMVIPRLESISSATISFPSFESVRKLEVACNLNSGNLRYLLSKCTNVKELVIYSLNYSKTIDYVPSLSTMLDDTHDFLRYDMWLKSRFAKYECRAWCNSVEEKVKIINRMTNILLRESSDHSLWNNLTSLTLAGWGFDEKNIVLLKNFYNLQTLIIDCAFFSNKIIENLPDRLETLEIVEKQNFAEANFRQVNFDPVVLRKLKEHTGITNLTLAGWFLKNTRILNGLPVNLSTLKIMCSSWISSLTPENVVGTVIIKKLILGLNDPNNSLPIYIDTNPMIRQYHKIFSFLRRYIDFESLEELALETTDELISIDKVTYRIK